MKQTPDILLLDNKSLSEILNEGEFQFVRIPLEEAKAIVEINSEHDIVCGFNNNDIEHIIFTYLGIENRGYKYRKVEEMDVGQNAIAFKRYITPSETSPVISPGDGIEAKKVNNVYIYCQLITRLK